jgi:hypothetical protein
VLKEVVKQAVAAAKAAVQDLAVDAVLVHRGATTHVPGSAPTYTETTQDIKIVVVSYTVKETDGERVRVGDRAGLIFPEVGDATPEPNDVVQIGAENLRIIRNDRVMAGDEVAMSQVQLRKL